jgi:hypothetical protein
MKLALLLLGFCAAGAFGHGGGLNAQGGHFNRSTGEYHCHREPCFALQRQSQPEEASPYSGLQSKETGYVTACCDSVGLILARSFSAGQDMQLDLIATCDLPRGSPMKSRLRSMTVQTCLVLMTLESTQNYQQPVERNCMTLGADTTVATS